MEKITKNLFEMALFCFAIRSFVVGPDISDALILISLVFSILYSKYYLHKNKLDKHSKIDQDIEMLKNEVSMLKLEKGFKKIGSYAQNSQTDLRF